MSLWMQVLLFGCWIAIGLFIGRRHRRTGTGILWTVILGPLSLVLFAYGELRRRSVRAPEPATPPASATQQNLELPIEVLVEGQWREGRLQAWAQGESAWRGWVEYSIDGVAKAAWFGDQQLRKVAA